MTFLLSKIVWALASPAALLFYVVLAALILQRRQPRVATTLLGAATLFLLALLTMPLAYWAASPLESRFAPVRVPPEHVDGVIVLGGAIDTNASNITGQVETLESAERLFAFMELARRFPNAKLIFSGGAAFPKPGEAVEADLARTLFAAQGLDISRIVFERESRNTWENALFSQKLMHPKSGETWLLITSSWHMPRSIGIFRRIGWNVTAYPVDHLAPDPHKWFMFEPEVQLRNLALASKEWIGLVSYYLLGRTSALFPAP